MDYTSLYKVLSSIDLSKNNVFNVSKILGNQYIDDANLEITTWDTSNENNLGNLTLRAGVNTGNGESGKVYIFSGVNTYDGRGITLEPDSNIKLYAIDPHTGNIDIIANHKLFLQALDNKITLNQITEDGVTYNVVSLNNVDEEGTIVGRVDLKTDEFKLKANKDLHIEAGENDAYILDVSNGKSEETVNTLNVTSQTNLEGGFEFEGGSFGISSEEANVSSTEISISAGYESDPSEKTLSIVADSSGSSINVDNITIDDALNSNNIIANNITTNESLISNTSFEAKGQSTLKDEINIEDNNEAGATNKLTVSISDVEINNSNGGQVSITTSDLDIDATDLSIVSNDKYLLTADTSSSNLNVKTATIDDELDITNGNLVLGTSNISGKVKAPFLLQEDSRTLTLRSGFNLADSSATPALILKTSEISGNYESSLKIDKVEVDDKLISDDIEANSVTAKVSLNSSVSFTAETSSTLRGTVRIEDSANEAGSLTVSSKTVLINNANTSGSTIDLNTEELGINAVNKTETISGNSTSTIAGTLTTSAGTINTSVTTSYSLSSNNKTILQANSSMSSLDVDNITAQKKIEVIEGDLKVGTSSNNGTITSPKKLTISTPDLTVNAGGKAILTANSSSSTVNVTKVEADTVEAPHIKATEDLTVGNTLMIYWDNTSNSVVFSKRG